MSEVWKPIKGYEGIYEVSNLGRVRSLPRMLTDSKGRRHPVPMKILREHDRKGYVGYRLCNGPATAEFSAHRLVAMAFIPNPDNLPVVNHRDENPRNNHVDNLEWCTIQYNTKYGNGIAKQVASMTYKTREVEQLSINGEHIAYFKSLSEASKATGADKSLIMRVCKGIKKTAGGFIWKYNN